jgi:hypothetical protein
MTVPGKSEVPAYPLEDSSQVLSGRGRIRCKCQLWATSRLGCMKSQDVRFAPESRHQTDGFACPLSANCRNIGLTEDLVRARVSLKWNTWGAPVAVVAKN